MIELTDRLSTLFRGATQQGQMNSAYRSYKRWRKPNHVKSVIDKPFRHKVWCKKGKKKYPHVSQNAAKAAGIRSMMYWLETVTSQHTSTDHDALRSAMVKGFVNADKSLRRAGRFLTVAQHDLFCSQLELALVSYNALAAESLELETNLYKEVPKMHAATHHYDSRTNPRRTHCYPDEDMVGRLKTVYNACHGGTAPVRALQRYCISVGLRWWVALHELRGLPYV